MRLEEIKYLYQKIKKESISSEKSVFYFCAYVPCELIYASGFKPIRFLPSPIYFARSDEYLPKYLCPYLRSITEEVLREDKRFEKVIFTDSCDSSRRIFEVWRYLNLSKEIYFLQIPFGEKEEDVRYFAKNIRDLFYFLNTKGNIENIFESINIYNLGRKKIRNSWQYSLLFYSMDIKEFLKLSFEPTNDNNKKFYLFSTVYPIELIEYMENLNLNIIYDDSCFGIRTEEEIKILDDDPFYSLAYYYLKREGCVRRRNLLDKISIIKERVKKENIKGVIFYSLKYCDPLLFYIPILKEELRKENIPSLILEDDFTMGIKGQIRTRLEAFLEMVG
ncbi:MAG: 2-hydroxyacyl-CoA dehydratase family protein [Dictyoglomus sp.]|nr:2-hydroxyacyl-CoA dehydratase family protein [Dictyoglomus sp.]MDW8189080.1 2-hydroxyacyl-CoA dehydratase family protein [Dictyoglomus sp.]